MLSHLKHGEQHKKRAERDVAVIREYMFMMSAVHIPTCQIQVQILDDFQYLFREQIYQDPTLPAELAYNNLFLRHF